MPRKVSGRASRCGATRHTTLLFPIAAGVATITSQPTRTRRDRPAHDAARSRSAIRDGSSMSSMTAPAIWSWACAPQMCESQ